MIVTSLQHIPCLILAYLSKKKYTLYFKNFLKVPLFQSNVDYYKTNKFYEFNIKKEYLFTPNLEWISSLDSKRPICTRYALLTYLHFHTYTHSATFTVTHHIQQRESSIVIKSNVTLICYSMSD